MKQLSVGFSEEDLKQIRELAKISGAYQAAIVRFAKNSHKSLDELDPLIRSGMVRVPR